MWPLSVCQILLMHFFTPYGRVSTKAFPVNWRDYLAPEVFHNSSNNEHLYDDSLAEGDIEGIEMSSLQGAAANAADDTSLFWPGNIVPYEISRRRNAVFRAHERRVITEAMDLITRLTWGCVKFVARTNENDFITFRRNIQCSSSIGHVGGSQLVNLAPGCLGEHGLVQHELMHVLGFYHEQSRMDRDNFVIVNYDNIDPADRPQFDKRKGETYGLPYDYESVMHYKYNAFAINPEEPTIIARTSRPKLGQTKMLSLLDVVRIQKRFKCNLPTIFNSDTTGKTPDATDGRVPANSYRDSKSLKLSEQRRPTAANAADGFTRDSQCSTAVLKASQSLEKNKSYYSPTKTFRFILQADNNLVLYRECDGQAVFSTFTHTVQSPTRAILQDDGNFVLHLNQSTEALWGTETWRYNDSRMCLADSGYFYLCNAQQGCYWRSSRHHTTECNGTSGYFPDSQHKYNVLARTGENVTLDKQQLSPNGEFYFQKHSASVIVWRKCDGLTGFKAVWQRDEEISHATVQNDGNFVIYDGKSGPLWSSHTWNPPRPDAELRFYDNGFLYLCNKDGCYWQSSGYLDVCQLEASKRLAEPQQSTSSEEGFI